MKSRKTQPRRRLAVAATAVVCGMTVLTCTSPVEQDARDLYDVKVDVFSAEYEVIGDRTKLEWQRPSTGETISCYGIYRYEGVDGDGNELNLQRTMLDSSEREHYDVLDLQTGEYSYYIVPFKVTADNDTIGGKRSEVKTIIGGAGITFTINNGATEIRSRECTVMMRDVEQRIAQVRFTQKVDRFFYKRDGSDTVHVSTHDVKRLSESERDLLELKDMYNSGEKTLIAANTGAIPLFGESDPDNRTDPIDRGSALWGTGEDPDLLLLDWVLERGAEEKRVWAEVTLNAENEGKVDTLTYGFDIAPYRVRVRLENDRFVYMSNQDVAKEQWDGPADATVVYWVDSISNTFTTTDYYVVAEKSVRFNLLIDVDSTMDLSFEYWLVLPSKVAGFGGADNTGLEQDSSEYWIETPHEIGFLTGYGDQHDENEVYEYSIDPTTTEGMRHLSEFKAVRNTKHYPYVDYLDETIDAGSARKNYERLIELLPTQKASVGRKEFMIGLRLKGRFFMEDRFALSNEDYYQPRVSDTKALLANERFTRMFFDFYEPRATFRGKGLPGYLQNGDTVTSVFDYYLDNSSVRDMGNCRVEDIRLVVARAPAEGDVLADGTVWTESTWDHESFEPATKLPISLEDLYSQKVAVYEYPVDMPLRVISQVRWLDLQATSWPEGPYFIGIVTSDEFGNEGLAPVFQNTSVSNPFLVHVLSGK